MLRDIDPVHWPQHTTYWGHVGLYGYRADVLQRWNALPHSQGPLEVMQSSVPELVLASPSLPVTP